MKQTINRSQFIDAFNAIRPDNFSYAGLCALFEYIEDQERDLGEEYELGVIALCCEFSEYESAIIAAEYMGGDFVWGDASDVEERENEALEYLQDRTQVLEFDGGIIIQDF